MNLSDREKNILAIVVAILFVFVIYHWGVDPLTKKQAENEKKKNALKVMLSNSGKESWYDRAVKLESEIPSGGTGQQNVLVRLGQMTKKNKLVMTELKETNGTTQALTNMRSYLLSCTVEGSLTGFKGFIKDIEAGPQIIAIRSFSYSSENGTNAGQLILEVFFDPNPAQVKAAAPPTEETAISATEPAENKGSKPAGE
ncbi:MAG: type II secretion system protein GspM [Chitinophagales bacterium]